MKIGIIGSGHIGATVGRHLVKAGHDVKFAARNLDKLLPLTAELGSHASTGSPREAALFGEVVIVATPYGAWSALGRDLGPLLKGKIVVDAANPYPQRDGDVAKQAIDSGRGSGLFTANHLPGANVVKAFNTISWQTLANNGGTGLAMAVAGDDDAAVQTVARLVRDSGFEPVIAGSLSEAKRFDPGTPAYGKTLSPQELRLALANAAA
jgi:predicted dinucleotide-binding enzyme